MQIYPKYDAICIHTCRCSAKNIRRFELLIIKKDINIFVMNMTIITSYEATNMYIMCGLATDEIYLFTLLYRKKSFIVQHNEYPL